MHAFHASEAFIIVMGTVKKVICYQNKMHTVVVALIRYVSVNYRENECKRGKIRIIYTMLKTY